MLPFGYVAVIGFLIVGFALFMSVMNYKISDRPSKLIVLLLMLTFVAENTATYFAYKFHNSNIVYGVFNPIQLVVIAFYYYESIKADKKKYSILVVGLVASIIGLLNYFFVQTPNTINNFFLLLESLVVIFFSLYSFYQMLLTDEDLQLTRYVHFWITSILLFFWTSTFLIWGLYDYLTIQLGIGLPIIHNTLLLVNVITYIGFGTVFLLYKKMQTTDGR